MRLLLPIMLLAALPAMAASAADTPAEAVQVAERHTRDTAGIVGYVSETDTRLQAPMTDRRTRFRAWVVANDGQPVDSKLLALSIDGKPAAEKQRRELETRTRDAIKANKNSLRGPFHEAYMADYTFSAMPCKGCEPGETAMRFKSLKRDERHGDGTMVLTGASGDRRVRRVQYQPSALPAQASEGEVTLEATGAWGFDRMQARYKGGAGPLTGAFAMTQRQSGHRRFATVEAALAAAPH